MDLAIVASVVEWICSGVNLHFVVFCCFVVSLQKVTFHQTSYIFVLVFTRLPTELIEELNKQKTTMETFVGLMPALGANALAKHRTNFLYNSCRDIITSMQDTCSH